MVIGWNGNVQMSLGDCDTSDPSGKLGHDGQEEHLIVSFSFYFWGHIWYVPWGEKRVNFSKVAFMGEVLFECEKILLKSQITFSIFPLPVSKKSFHLQFFDD